MKEILIIRAIKKYHDDSNCPSSQRYGWYLQADNGDLPEEGYTYSSRQEAYKACRAMYNNKTWKGKKINSGYKIEI